MEIFVKQEDNDGNVVFEGVLKKKEVTFVLNIGLNYLLSIGATPFIEGEDEEDEADGGGSMTGPGSDKVQ